MIEKIHLNLDTKPSDYFKLLLFDFLIIIFSIPYGLVFTLIVLFFSLISNFISVQLRKKYEVSKERIYLGFSWMLCSYPRILIFPIIYFLGNLSLKNKILFLVFFAIVYGLILYVLIHLSSENQLVFLQMLVFGELKNWLILLFPTFSFLHLTKFLTLNSTQILSDFRTLQALARFMVGILFVGFCFLCLFTVYFFLDHDGKLDGLFFEKKVDFIKEYKPFKNLFDNELNGFINILVLFSPLISILFLDVHLKVLLLIAYIFYMSFYFFVAKKMKLVFENEKLLWLFSPHSRIISFWGFILLFFMEINFWIGLGFVLFYYSIGFVYFLFLVGFVEKYIVSFSFVPKIFVFFVLLFPVLFSVFIQSNVYMLMVIGVIFIFVGTYWAFVEAKKFDEMVEI